MVMDYLLRKNFIIPKVFISLKSKKKVSISATALKNGRNKNVVPSDFFNKRSPGRPSIMRPFLPANTKSPKLTIYERDNDNPCDFMNFFQKLKSLMLIMTSLRIRDVGAAHQGVIGLE